MVPSGVDFWRDKSLQRLSGVGLHAVRIYSRVARRKPLVRLQNRRARILWATRTRNWTVGRIWSCIVFSDEARFNLSFDDGRVRCWRTIGEAYDSQVIALRSRSTTSVMVWGCISVHGTGELAVLEGNINHRDYIEVLDQNLLSSVENMFGHREHPFIFQDDNAPVHRARGVETWLENQGINRMQWPAQSPDLNPIENLWNDIGMAIMRERPVTKHQLTQCIRTTWTNITINRIRRLYDSLPRRVRDTVRMRGYPTRY